MPAYTRPTPQANVLEMPPNNDANALPLGDKMTGFWVAN
jgi:hypothetical protein